MADVHQRILETRMIDRYVAGELAGEEQDLLEQHLFDCPECFEELRWAESFRDTLRAAATEDATRAAAVAVPLGIMGWLARRPALRAALWTAVILTVLLSPAFLLRRQARLEARLQEARAALARAEASPPPVSTPALESELRTERDRLAADLARERQAREELAGRIAAMPQLQATTVLIPLGLVRDRSGEPVEIRLGRQPSWIVLSLEPPAGPAACRVTLLTAEGRTLWRGDRVEPSLYDTLLVTVPSSLLPPGRYRVRLEPLTAGAASEIPFRVLPPPA
jgi:anti-sigma factor RsiW